jgi:hypothetical protein
MATRAQAGFGKGFAHMNRPVVVAVAVAIVLGIATGAFAEHNRVKNQGDKTPTSTTRPVATGFFGANAAAACPGLKNWNSAAVAAYVALVKKGDWNKIRAELTPQIPKAQAALRSLIPVATPAGKAALEYVITFHDRLVIAAEDADSADAVFKRLDQLKTTQFTQDIAVISRETSNCLAK